MSDYPSDNHQSLSPSLSAVFIIFQMDLG